MTINEKTKHTTNEYLDKIKELEVRTKSDLKFYVEKAIESAKLEIALAQMTNYDTSNMSELAQNIQKYPNFEFDKQVVFGDYIAKSSMVSADFRLVDEEEIAKDNIICDEKENINNSEGEEIVEAMKQRKQHSQSRRKKIGVISVKLDDCEIFISASRLTKLDETKKIKEHQKALDDFEF